MTTGRVGSGLGLYALVVVTGTSDEAAGQGLPPHLSIGLLATAVGSVGAAVAASARSAESKTYLENIVG